MPEDMRSRAKAASKQPRHCAADRRTSTDRFQPVQLRLRRATYFATAIIAFMLGWYLQWYLMGPVLIAAE